MNIHNYTIIYTSQALQESQYETTPTTHIYQETHNTTTPPNPTYSEDRERTKSESSESDSQSTASAIFSAPPIRAAVLKNMFPGQQSNSGVVTKTIYSGSVGSTRKCMECGMINSKMAKKCQQCKSPVQVRMYMYYNAMYMYYNAMYMYYNVHVL